MAACLLSLLLLQHVFRFLRCCQHGSVRRQKARQGRWIHAVDHPGLRYPACTCRIHTWIYLQRTGAHDIYELGFFPQRYGCQQDESFGELWILGLKEALVFFYCQPEVAKLPQEVSVLEYLDTSHTVDEKWAAGMP